MKEIRLSQGKIALVDDEDFDYINQWKWYARKGRKTFYAARKEKGTNARTTIHMHQVVSKVSNNVQIDHRDTNGLNNQKYNLRVVNHRQNQYNTDKPRHNTSGYKGISWDKFRNNYRVYLTVKGKFKNIGNTKSLQTATKMYNKAATQHYGEFAKLHIYKEEHASNT
jgi:hypothetical protein